MDIENQKFIWVQHGGGEFPISQEIVTEFNCVFNPQKITPTEQIPMDKQNRPFFMYPYIPKDINIDSGNGGFIMEYTDNIEVVRQKWFSLMMSHYDHLVWIDKLIVLSSDWHIAIKDIRVHAEAHREKYPELWI